MLYELSKNHRSLTFSSARPSLLAGVVALWRRALLIIHPTRWRTVALLGRVVATTTTLRRVALWGVLAVALVEAAVLIVDFALVGLELVVWWWGTLVWACVVVGLGRVGGWAVFGVLRHGGRWGGGGGDCAGGWRLLEQTALASEDGLDCAQTGVTLDE
jgi:hypothetical protein